MSDSTSFKSAIAEVKLAYNIVDYIQQAGIGLKRNGTAKWKGLCPFHNEKTPSFSVDEHFQNYRCFGCGAHGDLISFVSATENLEFIDAIRKLADDKGLDLKLEAREDGIDYKSVRAALRSTANFFYKHFKELAADHPARKQIIERGLSLKGMTYGYAPDARKSLYKHLKGEGYSDEVILQTGACVRYEKSGDIGDFWNGRLMFFITDVTGKPIGFSGRKLFDEDKRGKYVNSPDGPLFDKGASLFNIFTAKADAGSKKEIFIAEGQFDVAAFIEAAMPQVVASSGTAFTERQAMMCRRLVTEEGRIIFAFDGDKAGVNAALKVFRSIPIIHSQAYAVRFPDGTDPCDYRLEHGNEAFEKYVREATVPLLQFVLTATAGSYDLEDPVGRTQFVETAARLLKTVPSATLREAYLKQVALDAFVPVEAVRTAVRDAKALDSETTSTNFELPPAPAERPASEPDEEQEEIIARFTTDEAYELSARLLTLTLSDLRFAPYTLKLVDQFPAGMRRAVEEIGALPPTAVPLPEVFTDEKLMAACINSDFFPLSHLMNEEHYKAQYKYIYQQLRKLNHARAEQRVRSKISVILERSQEQGVEFLERALAKEKSELDKLAPLEESAADAV